VKKVMDVAGHAAGGIAMADAISENYACDVVAAREYR
jgi:adenine/guanine phosphoribosyltransferase-like PRPP-binding protein